MQPIKVIPVLFMLLLFSSVNEAFSSCPNAGKCTCTLNSPNIAFGTAFNPLNNTALQQTFASALTVTCTLGASGGSSQAINYTITFAAGTYGTIAARYMRSSTPNVLYFNIYKDATYTTPLGTATGATITDSYTLGSGGCASPCTKSYSIYGKIPAQPTAKADTNQYVDAITATITY